MLTVVTGLPGAGKTLFTLSKLLQQFKGRRIFTYGIPGIDHEKLGTEDLEDPERWYDCIEGAVIIIDEAQKVFPQRPPSKPVPRKCSEFETHRHRGLDVILLTQDASTLDTHIRKLTGRHYHVHRLFGANTANVYEYPTFEPRPTDKKTQKGAMAVKLFSYDKSVFECYKSADLHTVKRKIPLKLIVVGTALVLGVGYLGWLALWAASGNLLDFGKEDTAVLVAPGVVPSGAPKSESKPGDIITDPVEYAKQMTPVIAGVPHSAPFYQQLFKAADFPVPYCVIIGELERPTGCRCFTQQMTDYDTTPEICRYYAQNGFFDPRGKQAGATLSAPPAREGAQPPLVSSSRGASSGH